MGPYGREAGPILTALEETGPIGATTRQLAERLSLSVDEVAGRLDALSERGSILRIGRGLWILQSYAELDGREDFIEPAEYAERFLRETGVPLREYRGPITFSENTGRPVHRWWPYVQGFSAEFVAGTLEREALPRGATVLDPFAGSGTTLVEVRRAGLRAVGRELLPVAVLAARVKTTFETDPAQLRRVATGFLRAARRAAPAPLPFLRETRRQFSPNALLALRRLRAALPPGSGPLADAVRIAFGRVLIPASRLRRSPCLGYGPSEERPDPVELFEEAVGEMGADLAMLARERERWGPAAEVREGDARSLDLPEGSVDLAVTSPPYVNGMDYVNNYKVDLAWLGLVRDYAGLRALRSRLVACDNLPRGEAERFRSFSDAPDPWLPEILERIQRNVLRKGSYRRDDVHAIVHRYFADLAPVLGRVLRALRPGGRFVLVVGDSLLAGIYVPGDLLLARIGAALGFRVLAVDVARQRRSGQRRSFSLRESVVALERPRAG